MATRKQFIKVFKLDPVQLHDCVSAEDATTRRAPVCWSASGLIAGFDLAL